MKAYKIKYITGADTGAIFYFPGRFGLRIEGPVNDPKEFTLIEDLQELEKRLNQARDSSFRGFILAYAGVEEIEVDDRTVAEVSALCENYEKVRVHFLQVSTELKKAEDDLEMKVNNLKNKEKKI